MVEVDNKNVPGGEVMSTMRLAVMALLCATLFGTEQAWAAQSQSGQYTHRLCTGYYYVPSSRYAGIYAFAFEILDGKTTRYADLDSLVPKTSSPQEADKALAEQRILVRNTLATRGTPSATDTVVSGSKWWYVIHPGKSTHISFTATPTGPDTLLMRRLINGRDVGTPPAVATCAPQ